jgi:4,5-dihydroxyphthalate decarboxylase
LNGAIKPEGIDLIPTVVREPHFGLDTVPGLGVKGADVYKYERTSSAPSARHVYDRQVKYGDFDVSEVPMTLIIMSVANSADDRWVGLPIFLSRRFFHMEILVRKDAGIEKPQDLKGKQVGVMRYQTVPPIWNRGMLQHEFGVRLQDMSIWRQNTGQWPTAPGFKPPSNIELHDIPPDKSVDSMLESGELQAALHPRGTTHHPAIRQLFPDVYAEGVRYYQKTGLYPINHGMVIKRQIAEQHPWAIINLFKAFQQAADLADQQRRAYVGYYLETGLLPPEVDKQLQIPLVRHGIKANKKVLGTWVQYCHEQGVISHLVKLEELFAAQTMDT